MSDTESSGPKNFDFGDWWRRLFQGQRAPVGLNLSTPPSLTPSSRPAAASPPERAQDATAIRPKPFLRFQQPATALSFIAHPVKFLPGAYQPNIIQPGAHDSRGNPGVWVNDMDASGNANWVDDPDSGLLSRKLYVINDALGARGRIADAMYEFRAVLQVGQNVVVYQLDNLNTGGYVVYGFPVEIMDATLAMNSYFRRLGENREKFSSERLAAMADRILERFPANEVALFNKGVTLIVEERFAEAHEKFDRALRVNSKDLLTLLYDVVALAALGRHEDAVARFANADAISEQGVRENIGTVGPLKKYLKVSVFELMRTDPSNTRPADLWLKYFSPIEGENSSSSH